jgi:hypothetical protein
MNYQRFQAMCHKHHLTLKALSLFLNVSETEIQSWKNQGLIPRTVIARLKTLFDYIAQCVNHELKHILQNPTSDYIPIVWFDTEEDFFNHVPEAEKLNTVLVHQAMLKTVYERLTTVGAKPLLIPFQEQSYRYFYKAQKLAPNASSRAAWACVVAAQQEQTILESASLQRLRHCPDSGAMLCDHGNWSTLRCPITSSACASVNRSCVL